MSILDIRNPHKCWPNLIDEIAGEYWRSLASIALNMHAEWEEVADAIINETSNFTSEEYCTVNLELEGFDGYECIRSVIADPSTLLTDMKNYWAREESDPSLKDHKAKGPASKLWGDPVSPDEYPGVPIAALYILHTLENVEDGIAPPPRMIRRPFMLCKQENIKAVILGQDPYPKEGDADGIAFSCYQKLSIPMSARTMIGALRNEQLLNTPDEFPLPNADFSGLVESGIFLINTALTTIVGERSSHVNIWKVFTKEIIKEIGANPEVAFILFGKEAQNFAKSIKGPKIETAHPSPMSQNKLPACNRLVNLDVFRQLEKHVGFIEWGRQKFTVYTDGACSGNVRSESPPGGWAFSISQHGARDISGAQALMTLDFLKGNPNKDISPVDPSRICAKADHRTNIDWLPLICSLNGKAADRAAFAELKSIITSQLSGNKTLDKFLEKSIRESFADNGTVRGRMKPNLKSREHPGPTNSLVGLTVYGNVPDNMTNNRGELLAAIYAIYTIIFWCNFFSTSNERRIRPVIDLKTDSQLLVNTLGTGGEPGWIHKWRKNGWKLSNKRKVENLDLVKLLWRALDWANINPIWVPGHSSVLNYDGIMNDLVDHLACLGKVVPGSA
jgi:uracil-DNA glycosylase